MPRRRRRYPMDTSISRALLGLILLMVGMQMFFGDSGFGIMLFISGLVMLWAIMRTIRPTRGEAAPFNEIGRAIRDEMERALANRDMSLEETSETPQRSGGSTRPARTTSAVAARQPGKMHRVAAKAVMKAGQNPREMVVAPVDLGILVYADRSATPVLYRETRLPEDAEYIRPFMLLRSPRHARGPIRFELYDGSGARRFVDESEWELKAGETFVYPSTWLPLRTVEDVSGEWTMRIYAAGTLLAAHEFSWPDRGGGHFRQYLDGDGEISERLAEELSGANLGRLSLDDLLDDQAGGVIEEDPAPEAARRAAQFNRR